MRAKTVLFNIYLHGNIEALLAFYERKLRGTNAFKDIEVRVTGGFDLYNNNKMAHYFARALALARTYDLVVSDFPTRLLGRGKQSMYMSHGYGTKMTPGLDEIKDPHKMKTYSALRNTVDYIITLSERDEQYYLKCKSLEGLPLPKYLPLGLPRNDALFDKNVVKYNREQVAKKLGIGQNRIMLYAPTWRGYQVDIRFPWSRRDFETLDRYLGEKGWMLIYRPHYIEPLIDRQMLSKFPHILTVDADVERDTQRLLAATDLLITDYSSIYVDFLILNKPIVFLPFDLEQYANYRGLVIDFDNLVDTPGAKISTVDDLINYLQEVEDYGDRYIDSRLQARRQFFKYLDGRSCERIWNFIRTIVKGKVGS